MKRKCRSAFLYTCRHSYSVSLHALVSDPLTEAKTAGLVQSISPCYNKGEL